MRRDKREDKASRFLVVGAAFSLLGQNTPNGPALTPVLFPVLGPNDTSVAMTYEIPNFKHDKYCERTLLLIS